MNFKKLLYLYKVRYRYYSTLKIKYKTNIQTQNNEKNKYLLASSGIRIFARIIDLIILFFFLFFTGIAIFYHGVYDLTNHDVTYNMFISMMFGHNLTSFSKETLSIMFSGWKYCLFSWEVFLVCFFWFIIIPLILKGRSIGKLICHITTIDLNNDKKWFWWNLILKEFFLWILMSFILIIYGFVCLALNHDAYKFNIVYIQDANTNGFKSFNGIYTFVFFFSISGLISIIFIIWMFFSTHTMNLQDEFSHTTVIYTKQIIQKDLKDNKIKITKQQILPGEVNLKELDKLIRKDK